MYMYTSLKKKPSLVLACYVNHDHKHFVEKNTNTLCNTEGAQRNFKEYGYMEWSATYFERMYKLQFGKRLLKTHLLKEEFSSNYTHEPGPGCFYMYLCLNHSYLCSDKEW